MADDVSLDTRKLNQFLKALKANPPKARVGILGADGRKGSDSTPGVTNADIGAKHEFGGSSMPIRSFLRMPLTDNLKKYLENANFFDPEAFRRVVQEGSLRTWVGKIGGLGQQIVLDAFQTGGFGKWKPSNMTHKKVKMTLVETQQLRNSITWDVKE